METNSIAFHNLFVNEKHSRENKQKKNSFNLLLLINEHGFTYTWDVSQAEVKGYLPTLVLWKEVAQQLIWEVTESGIKNFRRKYW